MESFREWPFLWMWCRKLQFQENAVINIGFGSEYSIHKFSWPQIIKIKKIIFLRQTFFTINLLWRQIGSNRITWLFPSSNKHSLQTQKYHISSPVQKKDWKNIIMSRETLFRSEDEIGAETLAVHFYIATEIS